MAALERFVEYIKSGNILRVASLLPFSEINSLYQGLTPLTYAILTGGLRMTDLLLRENNINVFVKNTGKNAILLGVNGLDALQVAERAGDRSIVERVKEEVRQAELIRLMQQIELEKQRRSEEAQIHQEKQKKEEQIERQKREMAALRREQAQKEAEARAKLFNSAGSSPTRTTTTTVGNAERKQEIARRSSLKNINSTETMSITNMVVDMEAKHVQELMSEGKIPAGHWVELLDNHSEGNGSADTVNNKRNECKAKLIEVQKQIALLQKQEHELIAQLDTLAVEAERIPKVNVSQRSLTVLATAETNGTRRLSHRVEHDTDWDTQDIGFFFNILGMARNSRKLADFKVDDLKLDFAVQLLQNHVSLADRLEIECAVDMLRKKKILPPYDKHRKCCPICTNTVADTLAEYQITLDFSSLELSPMGISYLTLKDISQHFAHLSAADSVNAAQNLLAVSQAHQYHLS